MGDTELETRSLGARPARLSSRSLDRKDEKSPNSRSIQS